MNFRKNLPLLMVCMLTFASLFQLNVKANSNNISHQASQDPNQIAVNIAFKQLQQLDTFIMQLALLISKGSIRDLPNPKATISILKDVRNLIGSITKEQATILAMNDPHITEQFASALTHICDELITYLSAALKNKLKGLKPFDVGALAKRGLPKASSPHILKQKFQKIDNRIEALQQAINNVGLVFYNKVARKLDTYVVSPITKYHIPSISFYTGSAAFTLSYALWKFGDMLKDPINPNAPAETRLGKAAEKLHSWIGKPWHISPRTGNPAEVGSDETRPNKNAAGTIPFTEYAIAQLMTNPIAAFAGGYFIKSFVETQWPMLTQKIHQTRDDCWNFLRGGQYLEQTASLSFLEPTYTFDDMIGLDEVKKEFSTIIQYLENPELLANMQASPEKGWLLTGEKRTGKSFSFECLSGEIKRMQERLGQTNKFSFLPLDASIIHQRGIKEILAYAQYNAPMVIFIDEIDLLNLNRVGDTKLLNEFLTGLQSSMNQDPSKIVILIAATNKPQTLDPALRANGRFGKEIRFEYPAKKYRIECIKRELMNMALDLKEFDIDRLAEKTDQKSIEDLRAIIRCAMTRAWMNSQTLTQQLLEESIDTEIHHIIMTDRKDLPEHENRMLASHFAGRALATLFLPMNIKLDKVTIHARMTDLTEEAQWADLYKDKNEKDKEKKIEHGHLTTRLINDSIYIKSKDEILNEAKSRIAGFVAEELLLGSCGFSCHPREHERAYRMIEQLVFEGINPNLVSKKVSAELKEKAFNILQQCKNEVRELLIDHHATLIAITEELIKERILTDKQILAIIDTIEHNIPAEPNTSVESVNQENKNTDPQAALSIAELMSEDIVQEDENIINTQKTTIE